MKITKKEDLLKWLKALVSSIEECEELDTCEIDIDAELKEKPNTDTGWLDRFSTGWVNADIKMRYKIKGKT